MANEVRVVVKADTGGARQEIQGFQQVLQGSFLNASNIAKGALLGLGAAGAGAFAGATKVAADFEFQLSAVAAVSGATKSEMAGLRQEALKIGADTAYSAGQATSAMEILAANGISAKDIMGGAARAAADLAAAGGTSLANAATIASTAMAVWNLRTQDLTDVVNRLAAAANVSRFGVEDMGQAIAMGGGVAAVAGVSFSDFAATIAATAQYFTSGSDAGTSFKTFLTSLTGNSEKAKETIAELGLEFFNAQGQLKPMSAIVQELHDKLGGLSAQQQTVALKTIFGNDAFRTAAGLMKMTGAEFEELSRKMGDTNAADVAKTRMTNLKGSMEELTGSIESLSIKLGSVALPALAGMADGATQAVNIISGLPTSTLATAAAFTAISAAAPAAVSAVKALANGISGLVTSGNLAKLSLTGIGLAIGGIATAADLILQKTTGHGLFEWIFGDVAGAERFEKAAAALEGRFKAAGEGADRAKIAMEEVAAAASRWADAERQLNEAAQSNGKLYERQAQIWKFGDAMREAEAAVRAAGKAMVDQNASAMDLWRTWADLPQKLKPAFEEVTNLQNILSSPEFKKAFTEMVNTGADEIEALKETLRQTAPAAEASASAVKTLGEQFDFAGKSAAEVDKILDSLIARFASGEETYRRNTFLMALYGEELADLKAKGDSLTAAERERVQWLEVQIQRLGEVNKAMDDNAKSVESMRTYLVDAMGEQGFAGFVAAMAAAKRGHEEQIDILGRVGLAYAALKDGDLARFRQAILDLRNTLTPEEFRELSMAAGSAIAQGIAYGMFTNIGQVGAAAEALMDAALENEASATARGQSVGQAIGQGVAQGMNSPSVMSTVAAAANNIISSIRSVLGIHSPSQVARDQVGKPVGQGIGQGIPEGLRQEYIQVMVAITELRERMQQALDIGDKIGAAIIQKTIESFQSRMAEIATAAQNDVGQPTGNSVVEGILDILKKRQADIENQIRELREKLKVAAAEVGGEAGAAMIRGMIAQLQKQAGEVAQAIKDVQSGKGYAPGETLPAPPGDNISYELGNDGKWYPRGQVPPDKQLVTKPVTYPVGSVVGGAGTGLKVYDTAVTIPPNDGSVWEPWEVNGITVYVPRGYRPPDISATPIMTGANGQRLVWVESLKAWVDPSMAQGVQGMTPRQWAASMTPQPWSGPPQSSVYYGSTQPLQVSIEIDGQQVARAILPDIIAEAERQGVTL